MKDLQIGKKDAKLSLFTNDMITYTENCKECTPTFPQKLLELINEYSKVGRYNISMQRCHISIC